MTAWKADRLPAMDWDALLENYIVFPLVSVRFLVSFRFVIVAFQVKQIEHNFCFHLFQGEPPPQQQRQQPLNDNSGQKSPAFFLLFLFAVAVVVVEGVCQKRTAMFVGNCIGLHVYKFYEY